MSFLYTCKAAELLLVVEIKLEGKNIFMSSQITSDTWGQCSFLTIKCKSRTFPRLQLIKTEPDEKTSQFFWKYGKSISTGDTTMNHWADN